MINILRGLAEEAGALHRLRLHQRRRDERNEAVSDRSAHRQVDQGQLKLGSLAGEVVEARTRDLGAALDIDRAKQLAELKMIFGLKTLRSEIPRRTQGLQHHIVILTARRYVIEDQISNLTQHLVESDADLVLCRLGLLDHVRELFAAAQQRRTVLTEGLRHSLAKCLLLGPELFELGNCVATRLVSLDQVINQRHRLAASPLGGTYPVWIEAEHLDINHRASLTALITSTRAAPWAQPTHARRGSGGAIRL